MQNTTIRQLRGMLAITLSSLIFGVTAQETSPSFEQALKATGWSVQREADGSLVLKPRESTTSNQDNKTTDDQWLQLKEKLQAAGWFVEREIDGSLILTPPDQSITANTGAAEQKSETGSIGSLDSMQQQLRDTGWQVIEDSDGSILLYPPGDAVATKPQPCPGYSLSAVIELPVDSQHEAYIIARDWLQKQPPYNAEVGRIRKILKIHVVSIVSDKAPYTLVQQIAIRNSDGSVIVLN